MTLLFATRTPLSPLENHIDQYRYASIRSRHTDSVGMKPPLPVFHVKPWEYQDLSVSGLLTSKTLLEQGRGVVVHCLGGEPTKASEDAAAFMEWHQPPLPRREPEATGGFT